MLTSWTTDNAALTVDALAASNGYLWAFGKFANETFHSSDYVYQQQLLRPLVSHGAGPTSRCVRSHFDYTQACLT